MRAPELSEERRYQVEARALRAAAERALLGLLAQSREGNVNTSDILDAIEAWRSTAGVDFSCPIEREAYRAPGGIPQKS